MDAACYKINSDFGKYILFSKFIKEMSPYFR